MSTGLAYRFYKYDARSKEFVCSDRIPVQFQKGISYDSAAGAALPVVKRLVHILKKQIEAMRRATGRLITQG